MEELRRLRKQRGLTQAKLAVQAGLDPSSLSQIETGARQPNTRTLEKLAGALGVGVVDLFPKGQAPLPLEAPAALEASDDDFEEMLLEADEDRLGAMKRELAGHLPGGGPLPRPTDKQLLAMHRCIAIYREQKERAAAEEARLMEMAKAASA